MFNSKAKQLFRLLTGGLVFIFTYTTAILRFGVSTKKECHTGLGILHAMNENFESVEWTKLEESEGLHPMPIYRAQPAPPAHKNFRRGKKHRKENATVCPFYPYADGGRVAKWDCGFVKSKEILSIVPVVKGCPADLGKDVLMTQFIQKLYNRTLWILGESLSVEIFIALSCRLRGRSDSKFHPVTKEDLKNVANDELRKHLHTRDDMRGIHCVKLKDGT